MRTDAARAFALLGLAIAVTLIAGSVDDPIVAQAMVAGSAATVSLSFRTSVGRDDAGLVSGTSASLWPVPSIVATSAAASPDPATSAGPTEMPRAPAPAPVVRAAPSAAAPAPTVALTCPADWFCYPRLGIRGPIVPYTDCYGTTDVGTDIRAFTCLSPRYLMGHAYTQMGRITEWQAGDTVYAYGLAFSVTGAIISRSCDPPRLPLASLSMQTSLSTSACGNVLVVQAR